MDKLQFELEDGPFGDQMSRYKVKSNSPITIRDILEFAKFHREWGRILDALHIWEREFDIDYSYSSSNLKDPLKTLSNDILDKVVEIQYAHGGWSSMDYYVKFPNN